MHIIEQKDSFKFMLVSIPYIVLGKINKLVKNGRYETKRNTNNTKKFIADLILYSFTLLRIY